MTATSEEIARLTERVANYRLAEAAVLRNQSYEMPDGRRLERANLSEIRKGLIDAEAQLALATGANTRPRGRARAGVIGGRVFW